MAQLLERCLPLDTEPMRIESKGQGNEIVVTANSINVALLKAQVGNSDAERLTRMNLEWGPTSNLIQVAHFEGRYYLKNGYHRAFQLGRLGIRQMPCIVVEANKWEDVVGIGTNVFPKGLLESANPPTCGHFLLNRAYPVTLPILKRVIRIVMTADLVPEEE